MDFATQMKVLRTARNLTQEELADRTGIPTAIISRMETGKITPAGEWLASIRRELNWPDDESVLASLAAK